MDKLDTIKEEPEVSNIINEPENYEVQVKVKEPEIVFEHAKI